MIQTEKKEGKTMEIIINVVLYIIAATFFMGSLLFLFYDFHEGMIGTAEFCLLIADFVLILILFIPKLI
jgi:hypothetical protein